MNPDYISASIGGLLIGLSCIIGLGVLGKILGISGIFWRSVSNIKQYKAAALSWQWYFLAGLIIGPLIVHYVFGFPIPVPRDSGYFMAMAAGLFVGFGSNLGSGCTSGHGICGIGRLSKRSIVSAFTFMSSGIITVYISNLFT